MAQNAGFGTTGPANVRDGDFRSIRPEAKTAPT
jgi:hypothetical protein